MGLIDSLKPFWPLILTFILPRAYSTYNTLKLSYRTRPPPKPLSTKTSRSLNIFFISIVIFLLLSYRTSHSDLTNIFTLTSTRLNTPTDIIANRLHLLRSPRGFSTEETSLLEFLKTPALRVTYLTVGPDALLSCPFCSPLPKFAYTYHIYAIPSQILFPHLLHITLLGLGTSSPLVGTSPARYRTKFILAALCLVVIDVYLVSGLFPLQTYYERSRGDIWSLYYILSIARPLVICLFDAVCAVMIWANGTGRFVFFPFLADPNAQNDVSALQQGIGQGMQRVSMNQAGILAKMRAYTVARNAVVRDENLKSVETRYWKDVGEVETREGVIVMDDDDIWLDEGVQEAMNRVVAGGGADLQRQRGEMGVWVDGVTKALEET